MQMRDRQVVARVQEGQQIDGLHWAFVRLVASNGGPAETIVAMDAHVDVDASGSIIGITVHWLDKLESPDGEGEPGPLRAAERVQMAMGESHPCHSCGTETTRPGLCDDCANRWNDAHTKKAPPHR